MLSNRLSSISESNSSYLVFRAQLAVSYVALLSVLKTVTFILNDARSVQRLRVDVDVAEVLSQFCFVGFSGQRRCRVGFSGQPRCSARRNLCGKCFPHFEHLSLICDGHCFRLYQQLMPDTTD